MARAISAAETDVAGPGATTAAAELDQHVDRPVGAAQGRRVRRQRLLHQGHRAHVVGPGDHLGPLVGGQLVGDPAQRQRRDDRVGDQHPRDPVRPGHRQLRQVGQGDRPRPRGQLVGPEPGRHGGLAVRRQIQTPLGAPARHGGHVVPHRRCRQGQQRRREPAQRHAAAPRPPRPAAPRAPAGRPCRPRSAARRPTPPAPSASMVAGSGSGMHTSERQTTHTDVVPT